MLLKTDNGAGLWITEACSLQATPARGRLFAINPWNRLSIASDLASKTAQHFRNHSGQSFRRQHR